MYIRTIKRKNKDGSVVEYVQLANNVWNKEKGFAQAQVIHSFGRRDQLDVKFREILIIELQFTNGRFIKCDSYRCKGGAIGVLHKFLSKF